MNRLSVLVLAVAAMATSAHAITWTTDLYDDNGAGGSYVATGSGTNSYTLNLSGYSLAPGDILFLTWNSHFVGSASPISGINLSVGYTVTGALPLDTVEGNMDAGVYVSGIQYGTNNQNFSSFGNGTFTQTMGVGVSPSVTAADVQSSTIVFANTSGGTVVLDTVTAQAVPEPASMAALAVGGIALLRRRRKA